MPKPLFTGELRALGITLAALGGVVAVAACGEKAAPPPAAPTQAVGLASTVAASKSLCRQFWEGDMDDNAANSGTGGDVGNVELTLYPHENPDGIDLGVGDFVGGVENTNASTPSTEFPELKARHKGCIWFWKTGSNKAAYFYHYNGGEPVKLAKAVYCRHIGSSRRPFWGKIPTDCGLVSLSVNGIDVEIDLAGAPLTTQALSSRLQQALVNKGMNSAEALAAVKAVVDEDGPWYPCDPNGCCRAT